MNSGWFSRLQHCLPRDPGGAQQRESASKPRPVRWWRIQVIVAQYLYNVTYVRTVAVRNTYVQWQYVRWWRIQVPTIIAFPTDRRKARECTGHELRDILMWWRIVGEPLLDLRRMQKSWVGSSWNLAELRGWVGTIWENWQGQGQLGMCSHHSSKSLSNPQNGGDKNC